MDASELNFTESLVDQNVTDNRLLSNYPTLRQFFMVALTAESICGTLGNFLVILIFCVRRELRVPANFFIVNLSLADLLITAVAQPSNVFGAINKGSWYTEHHTVCSLIATICATGCISSTWNILLIALNRYVVICKYRSYHVIYTRTNTLLMCVGVWLVVYLLELPNHLGWGDNRFSRLLYLCTFATHHYYYSVFYMTVGVLLPVILSFFAYFAIFRYVKSTKFFRNRIGGIGSSVYTVPTISPHMCLPIDFKATKSNIKLAQIMFRLFVVFVAMWFPAVMVFIVDRHRTLHPSAYILSSLLGHGNSTLNVILYATSVPQFRQAYRSLWNSRRDNLANRPVSASWRTSRTRITASNSINESAKDKEQIHLVHLHVLEQISRTG